jgi:hypothetical protein
VAAGSAVLACAAVAAGCAVSACAAVAAWSALAALDAGPASPRPGRSCAAPVSGTVSAATALTRVSGPASPATGAGPVTSAGLVSVSSRPGLAGDPASASATPDITLTPVAPLSPSSSGVTSSPPPCCVPGSPADGPVLPLLIPGRDGTAQKYRPSRLCARTDTLRLNNINTLVCRLCRASPEPWRADPGLAASRSRHRPDRAADVPARPRSWPSRNVRPPRYLRTNIE